MIMSFLSVLLVLKSSDPIVAVITRHCESSCAGITAAVSWTSKNSIYEQERLGVNWRN